MMTMQRFGDMPGAPTPPEAALDRGMHAEFRRGAGASLPLRLWARNAVGPRGGAAPPPRPPQAKRAAPSTNQTGSNQTGSNQTGSNQTGAAKPHRLIFPALCRKPCPTGKRDRT